MIVYAGKQYWNDFNNWDEALFQDANRPRDDNKFQIRPWVNTRKQDLRTSNSWIAAQGTFFGTKSQAGQSSLVDANGNWLFNTASMTNEWATVIWKPYVNPQNWDIVVGKSWIYAVTCQAVFIAPNGYNVNNSVNYKFYVAFLLNWQPSMYTQGRGCWAIDAHSVFYVGWFDTWDKLNVGFLHTDTSDTFTVSSSINLYRLS